MKNVDRFLKAILFFIALTLVIPFCFSQTPVEIRKQPIQVFGFATNGAGQLFVIPLGVQTNAIMGGLIGISNYPSGFAFSNYTGQAIWSTGEVSQAGAPWAFTGAVTQGTSPWTVNGQIGSTGLVTVTGQIGTTGTVTVTQANLFSNNIQQIGGQAVGAGGLPVTNGATAFTVQPGNTANTTPWLTTETPATSGGLSMFTANPGAVIYSNIVKSSAGQVYNITCMNSNAAGISVKLYNLSSAFNPSAQTPVWVTMVPGNTAGAGYTFSIPGGLAFSTGIGISATQNIATNDVTALTAGQTVINVGYK